MLPFLHLCFSRCFHHYYYHRVGDMTKTHIGDIRWHANDHLCFFLWLHSSHGCQRIIIRVLYYLCVCFVYESRYETYKFGYHTRHSVVGRTGCIAATWLEHIYSLSGIRCSLFLYLLSSNVIIIIIIFLFFFLCFISWEIMFRETCSLLF